MFLSKIWFFLVAIAAAAAITIAFVMPKPAERATAVAERQRLQRTCSVVGIVLRSNARSRVQNAASVARGFGLGEIASKAGRGEIVSGDDNSQGRAKLAALGKEFEASGVARPAFLFLVDGKGRVVARSGLEDDKYGDVLGGYYAVDDAIAGYVRDDVWVYGDKLYRVATTPVFTDALSRTGALVIGYAFDNDFAEKIGDDLAIDLSFYVNGKAVSSNHAVQVHGDVVARYQEAIAGLDGDKPSDCSAIPPFEVTAGGSTYSVLMSRLPGEARGQGAFYAVFTKKPTAIGFMGTLDEVKKDDLSFSSFPWIKLAILFVLIVGVGLGLMVFETDLPLRKLTADAVELAQSDSKERLNEEAHRGKFGSIARSVNIHVDKLGREARAAKKEFDQLIGPAPEGSSGAIGLPGLSGPAKPAPPPPSEFKFSSAGSGAGPGASGDFALGGIPQKPTSAPGLDLSTPVPTAPPRAGTAPPVPPSARPGTNPPPKPPVPGAARPPLPAAAKPPVPTPSRADAATNFDENAPDNAQESYFKEIYQDFLALKRRCGEPTDSLTFEKFSKKLIKNRDALIAKHNCESVKFQVYIKDGKAALKASPVKS